MLRIWCSCLCKGRVVYLQTKDAHHVYKDNKKDFSKQICKNKKVILDHIEDLRRIIKQQNLQQQSGNHDECFLKLYQQKNSELLFTFKIFGTKPMELNYSLNIIITLY